MTRWLGWLAPLGKGAHYDQKQPRGERSVAQPQMHQVLAQRRCQVAPYLPPVHTGEQQTRVCLRTVKRTAGSMRMRRVPLHCRVRWADPTRQRQVQQRLRRATDGHWTPQYEGRMAQQTYLQRPAEALERCSCAADRCTDVEQVELRRATRFVSISAS